ncbi:lasso peptide biosynthesis B2 protein [Sphingomonas sp. YL-JM2C]
MQLSDNTYLAAIGDRSIVLDLQRDRYVGLNQRLTQLALEVGSAFTAKSSGADTSSHALDTLVREGVIAAESRRNDRADTTAVPDIPSDTRWPSRRFGLGLDRAPRLSASALWALTAVKHSLERRKFVDTIAWLRARHSRAAGTGPIVPEEDLIDAYFAARPWFPVKPICRLDAPALCVHLWRYGHDPFLVFGVRMHPFAAHCWAQSGVSALLEPADRLQQYTPIMSV